MEFCVGALWNVGKMAKSCITLEVFVWVGGLPCRVDEDGGQGWRVRVGVGLRLFLAEAAGNLFGHHGP